MLRYRFFSSPPEMPVFLDHTENFPRQLRPLFFQIAQPFELAFDFVDFLSPIILRVLK